MEAASPDPLQPLTLCKVFSETRRISKSQPRTFHSLALLFLFPFSLATVLYPVLAKSLSLSPDAAAASSSSSKTFVLLISTAAVPAKIILLAAAAYLLGLILSPCAVGSIIYTALHAFRGEPVKLNAAIKSIANSFFPLLSTMLAAQLIIFTATFAFALLIALIIGAAKGTPLGLTASPYLLGFATGLLVVLVMYFQVNWTLAYAVVVAESSRGFAALERSSKLIKGKRGLALSLSLIYGCFYLVFLWDNSFTAEYAASLGGASRPSTAAEWRDFFLYLVLKLLFSSAMLTLTQLSNLVANTVLYAYCRAVNDDDGEFSGDYFRLPVDDDEKAPLLV